MKITRVKLFFLPSKHHQKCADPATSDLLYIATRQTGSNISLNEFRDSFTTDMKKVEIGTRTLTKIEGHL